MRVGVFLLSVLSLPGVLLVPAPSSEAPFPPPTSIGRAPVLDLSGDAKRLPRRERDMILRIAREAGVDARLLAAVRLAENGGPGREFGVLSPSTPTYEEQGRVAAETIRNVIDRYQLSNGHNPVGADGRLTIDFLRYFSRGGPGYLGYAPIGARNDATNLNAHHFRNVLEFYWGIDLLAQFVAIMPS